MKHRFLGFFLRSTALIVVAALISGFSFDGSGIPGGAEVSEIIDGREAILYKDLPKLYAVHGQACGKADLTKNRRVFLELETGLPHAHFTAAIVIPNGWRLSHDEERANNIIESRVYDTEIDSTVPAVRWRAAGFLGLFDGPVTYCHWYTVVAWTDELQNFFVGQQQQASGQNRSHHSPLLNLPNHGFARDLEQFADPVVLPQGFYVSKDDGLLSDYFLQFAYAMGRPERVRYAIVRHLDRAYDPPIGLTFSPNPTSTAASGDFSDVYDPAFVTWESRAIYKDEDNDEQSSFHEYSVVLAGEHIGMVMPHYGITPRNESDANLFAGHLSKYRTKKRSASYKVVAENVPFQFAVPVLTGWNLNLIEDDEQIREIGIWIDDVKWYPRGRHSDIEYSVNAVFVDDEDSWFDIDVGVSYLGFNNLTYDP